MWYAPDEEVTAQGLMGSGAWPTVRTAVSDSRKAASIQQAGPFSALSIDLFDRLEVPIFPDTHHCAGLVVIQKRKMRCVELLRSGV